MAYSKKIFDSATEKLNARRTSALNMAEYRTREVYTAIPRIKEIETELSSVGISTAKAVLSGKDVVAELNVLKEKNFSLQNELKSLLVSNGYTEDYLEPQFVCDKCSDTGYIELDNKTITCDCYKKLLSAAA